MKLANPLYYPLPVLVGAIALVLGVRGANLPGVVMLPVAVGIATVGATLRKSQQPEALNLGNPALERDLQQVRQQAQDLTAKARALRSEAVRLLTDSTQVELLAAVEYACDRAIELPAKIDQLAQRLQGTDSLLSVTDLQRQLNEVRMRLQSSSGAAREQLTKVATGLARNIQLAQQGQDARQAQVVSLSGLILDAAAVLQELQNKLRTANLTDATEAMELRSLSDELKLFQENVDLLVAP